MSVSIGHEPEREQKMGWKVGDTSDMKMEIVMDGGISRGQEDERQERERRKDTKFHLKML